MSQEITVRVEEMDIYDRAYLNIPFGSSQVTVDLEGLRILMARLKTAEEQMMRKRELCHQREMRK